MATLDFGSSGGSVDPNASYDWHGVHTFYSSVNLALDVDLRDASLASRAVNAGSVATYVSSEVGYQLSVLTGAGSQWDVHAQTSFLGERTYFRLNPYLGENISLWDITDLTTWPDQVQLHSAVKLGDAKDYIDQNLNFAVQFVLGELSINVGNILADQLPSSVAAILDEQLPGRQAQYTANVIYPEVDQRISAALTDISGVNSTAITDEVATQLPTAIGLYAEANIFPAIGGIAIEAVQPELVNWEAQITLAYTAAINTALEGVTGGSSSWTQAQIEQIALDILVSQLAQELPPAVTAEVSAQLNARLTADIDAALALLLPDAVATEVNSNLETSVNTAVAVQLDATLLTTIQTQLTTELPVALDAALSTALTTEVIWPLVQADALAQVQQEITNAVPTLVQQELGGAVQTLVNQELTAQLPGMVTPVVNSAISAILPGEIAQGVAAELDNALAEGGSITQVIDARTQVAVENYYSANIEPGISTQITDQINSVVPSAVQQEVAAALGSTDLLGTIQTEVQAALQPELDQFVSTVIPNIVNLQLANDLPGMVTAQINERFGDARIPEHRRYEVVQPSQLWLIEHNMGTVNFRERLYNSDGRAMFAHVEPVNETSFVVRLTSAMTGWVDVEFFL